MSVFPTSLARSEPVLVLGMHRSGTALLARILERLGVFMGADLDPNHEAWFFLDLNRVALAQCGLRWDQPEGLDTLFRSPELVWVIRSYFEYMLQSPAVRSYTGIPWYRRKRGVDAITGLWGWKDPRTVLLLPIWLEVFPRARVVHLVRHGVDVAASLRTRQQEVLAEHLELLERGKLFDWKDPERWLFDSARAHTLEGGFELWEFYMRIAEDFISGREHHSLTFEELVKRPGETIGVLAENLELDPEPAAIDAAAALPRKARGRAYRNDPELAAFAESVSERLAAFGYGPG